MQNTSLQAFLAQLIDYAGLFPPASLPLEMVIRNYAAYQSDRDSWMLGRLIIPAWRMNELAPHMTLFSDQLPLACAALGRKSDDAADCLELLRTDLAEMAAFCDRHGDTVKTEVFELPLPPALPEGGLLEAIAVETAARGLQTFCEITVPLNAGWKRQVITTLDAIAMHNAVGGVALGVKLRTGGLTADAFPSPAQVAAVLLGCRDRSIAIKFTAGLHHPIRMYCDQVNTLMHGFVNVFSAAMLAQVYNLDAFTTEQILADEAPASFSFTAEGLAWRDKMVSVPQITQLRATAVRSYGSCSFNEPRDDLRALRIL